MRTNGKCDLWGFDSLGAAAVSFGFNAAAAGGTGTFGGGGSFGAGGTAGFAGRAIPGTFGSLGGEGDAGEIFGGAGADGAFADLPAATSGALTSGGAAFGATHGVTSDFGGLGVTPAL